MSRPILRKRHCNGTRGRFMSASDLVPKSPTATVNLGFLKLEADWSKRSQGEKLNDLRSHKERIVVEYREALNAHDRSGIRKWKGRLKAVEDAIEDIERVALYRE